MLVYVPDTQTDSLCAQVQFQGEYRRHQCTYLAEYLFQPHVGCHNLIYFILKKDTTASLGVRRGAEARGPPGERCGEPRVLLSHHVDELDQL